MDDRTGSGLIKLSHSDLLIELGDDDLRGRTALDRDGERLGGVDDLLIDPSTRQVRFLEVSSGGFLGIGDHKSLIPVEAVSKVDEEHVYIDHTREHIAAAPVYAPHVVAPDLPLYEIYEHYGYPPPWVPGAETV